MFNFADASITTGVICLLLFCSKDLAVIGETVNIARGKVKKTDHSEEEQKKEYLEQNPDVKESWDEEFGDRENQIVIIGKGYDKEAVKAELIKCLDEKATA